MVVINTYTYHIDSPGNILHICSIKYLFSVSSVCLIFLMISKSTPLALFSPLNFHPLHPIFYPTSPLGYINLTYPKLIDFQCCPPKAVSLLCTLHFNISNYLISCSRKKKIFLISFILYIISNTSKHF